MYAANYAERVFHDRQLCEHISKALIEIGFDGRPNWTGPPKQWIRRQNRWPSWAVDAVVARDRGHCGACGVSITAELSAPKHIDHIVALANGGTNDLSNLQLLCDACNLKKRARTVEVRSSFPIIYRSRDSNAAGRTETRGSARLSLVEFKFDTREQIGRFIGRFLFVCRPNSEIRCSLRMAREHMT